MIKHRRTLFALAHTRTLLLAQVALWGLLCAGPGTARAQGDKNDKTGKAAKQVKPSNSATNGKGRAAGTKRDNAACLECHADQSTVEHKRLVVSAKALGGGPHTEDNDVSCISCHTRAAKVADISEHGKLGPASCDGCHDAAAKVKLGAHGNPYGSARRPDCASCHGAAHDIRPVADDASPVNRANQSKTCERCHKEPAIADYHASVHGQRFAGGRPDGPVCTSCHGAHQVRVADAVRNAPFKIEVTERCAACHEKEGQQYKQSVHGQALLQGHHFGSASCVDCHLGHRDLPPSDPRSPIHASHIVERCAGCHGNARMIRKYHLPSDVVSSYGLSYHGKAQQLGELRAASCLSCHQSHAVFRASDPRSSVHPNNLRASCGKCHPGASANFIKGKIHRAPAARQNRIAWLVSQFYIVLIIVVVGGMALHNLLDWLRKMMLRARAQRAMPHIVRISALERAMHAVLLSSFIWLAYTGFALIYPHAWWAAPLSWISATEDFRSTAHRVAGAVLGVLALAQLWFLFFHHIGREQRRRFAPTLKDFRDLWHNVLFFFGRRHERPRFGRFGYIEKAEYWALVWGTVVMALTGLVLWFKDWSLVFMPRWLWEVFLVVHRFEAILAVLSIVVWHFYYVFLNPDTAPMALSWLTGRITLEDLKHEHPEEYDEIVNEHPEQIRGRAGADPER